MSTTAAKRLRRAAIGGVAALATLGGTLALATSPAWAFGTAGGGTLGLATGATAASVVPSATSQALPGLTLTLKDATGWIAGDFITLNLATSATPTATLCNTSSNLNQTASLSAVPAVSASYGTSSTSFTGFTVSQASTGSCNVKDAVTLALTQAPPDGTSTMTFNISGLNLNLGSYYNSTNTPAIYVDATSSNGSPFGTASATDGVSVATVANQTVTIGSPVGANPSNTGVTFPTTVVRETVAGTVGTGITLTLPGTDVFATVPTLTAPAGITVTAPTTVPSGTLTWGLSAATTTPGTFTFTGGSVNFDAVTGVHSVTVKNTASTPVTLGTAAFAAVETSARIGGIDRNATAASLFAKTVTALGTAFTHNAVMATGMDFPDALSANYLAQYLKTGVLLTDTNTLSSYAMTQLVNNSVSTVYIVGGVGAVSQAVQNQVAAMHVGNNPSNALINVVRLAGNTRYGTNSAVDLFPGMSATTAIVATGQNFPDALTVGPVVYAKGYPLVLTLGTSLSPEAATTLQSLGVRNVIVVGGTGAVSSAVTTAITNLGITVQGTLAGADRTQTAAAIANWEFASTSTTVTGTLLGLGWTAPTNMYVARGDIFPDALVAGPLAGVGAVGTGLAGQPILLSNSPTSLGAGIPSYAPSAATSLTTVTSLGLTGAVSIGTQLAAIAAVAG